MSPDGPSGGPPDPAPGCGEQRADPVSCPGRFRRPRGGCHFTLQSATQVRPPPRNCQVCVLLPVPAARVRWGLLLVGDLCLLSPGLARREPAVAVTWPAWSGGSRGTESRAAAPSRSGVVPASAAPWGGLWGRAGPYLGEKGRHAGRPPAWCPAPEAAPGPGSHRQPPQRARGSLCSERSALWLQAEFGFL